MSLAKRPPFAYQPLVAPDAIRLALLHPALDISAEVECSIEHATLSHQDQELVDHYVALSYVWGDPTDTRQIIIGGCPFYITATLESALRHIRDPERIIRIWADALCINQANEFERNQQVSQMGTIYAVAQHTVIFLGDSTEQTDSIFIELTSLGTTGSVRPPGADLRLKYSEVAFESLTDGFRTQILQRPWFTRVWVFQELLLSRDPWLQCGKKRLKWGNICHFLYFLHLGDEKATKIEVLSELGRLEELASARSSFQDYTTGKGQGNPLLSVLSLRRGLGVSDARDMIYAHLGIVSDSLSGQLELEVDYSKTYHQLLVDVTRYFLKKYMNFRILSHVEDVDLRKRHQNLPSWVPDWTSNKVSDPRYYDRLQIEMPVIGRKSARFSFALSAESKHQLVCGGYITGRIGTTISNILSLVRLDSDEIRKSWLRYLNLPCRFIHSGQGDEYVPNHNEDKTRYEMLVDEAAKAAGLQNSPFFRKSLNLYQNDFESEVQRLWIRSTEKGPYSENLPHLLTLVFSIPFQLARNNSYFSHPLETLQILEEKRLCLVEGSSGAESIEFGQIALVPQWTQAGDLICSLGGESSDMVLRPIKSAEPPKEGKANDRFTFVGMCYTGWGAWLSGSASETKKTFFLE